MMNDLDKKMLDAIREDNETQTDFSEEKANTLQLIIHSFKGTFRLTFAVVFLIQLTCFGLAFYFGYHMFNEVDMTMKINWLAGTILAVIGFAVARLFFFMELNRLSVIREVKRVELQMTIVAKALEEKTERR